MADGPDRQSGKEQDDFVQLAASVPAKRLVELAARQAALDRVFAARLRGCAGRLEPPSPAELQTVRNMINEAAAIPDSGYGWGLHHIYRSGLEFVAELEVLAAHPPNNAMLALVEHAATVWNVLAVYLSDDWETYENEPVEIGDAIRAVHLDVCRRLRPDPMELAERLAELTDEAQTESCLDDPHAYAPILGPEAVAEYRRRTGR